MVGTRRNPPREGVSLRAAAALRSSSSSSRPRRAAAGRDALPSVYCEMLVETGAGPSQRPPDSSEPPLKRPKQPGQRSDAPKPTAPVSTSKGFPHDEDEDEDEDVEFEDVALPPPVVQTTELGSEDSEDSEDDAMIFQDVELTMANQNDASSGNSKDLELNLTAQTAATPRKGVDRRKPVSRAERERRVEVHKMHLLCLLSHAARRNHWCNDAQVHESLRPLLTDKIITYLNPGTNLSQFGRTESLKNGLEQVSTMFKTRFEVTERGMKRALWAEVEDHLKDYQLPRDIESTLEKDDFREAAETLQGSRDVGAQLFCALLREAGVEARLVCSLQPLSFASGTPTLPKPKAPKKSPRAPRAQIPDIYQTRPDTSAPTATSSPRRRLGHPNAAAYHVPSMSTPTPRPSTSSHHGAPKPIRNESPFPVYWVEVLDVAHQKWQPVDPLVTATQWKPAKLEPPASDRENSLCYAIAFEDDGSAKDVTRRYAKAYNSKTRRQRIDRLENLNAAGLSGERWLRRALKLYRHPSRTDLGQIEDNELAAMEAREPMPRNVADFKDHPVYALERHFRRHEVLLPSASSCGTVAAGSRAPLERIYRRRDVRVARSAEKWYRLGRVVRGNEIPAKWLPKQRRKKSLFGSNRWDDDGEDDEDPVLGPGPGGDAGTPIFTVEQTEPYVPPPVEDGVVPKNKFGNVEVYVPSMVPVGGAHIPDDHAAQAAFLVGVDYAPALTGFRFKGRHGTAVLQGAVVPAENAEAVRAVVAALGDAEVEAEEEGRRQAALRMWSRLLKGLRIRERILVAAEDRGEHIGIDRGGGGFAVGADDEDGGEGGSFVPDDDDDGNQGRGGGFMDDRSHDTEEYEMMDDDEGGGGFLI